MIVIITITIKRNNQNILIIEDNVMNGQLIKLMTEILLKKIY